MDSASVAGTERRPDSVFIWPGTGTRHFLKWEATSMYDSNVLRNDLVSSLYRGGSISREVRQRSESTSSSTNRAGYVLEGELSYSWGDSLFGTPTMRPRFSAAYRDLLGVRYSDDLYHVTFFGNADFENATAELGPSAFEKVRYQTFGFGIEDTKTRSYLMLHLVSGQDLYSADIDQARLFTGTDGRYLRLDLDASYARSEDDSTSDWRSRGMGAAISARVNAPVRICGKSMSFSLMVQDLGAIAWNENSLRIPRDTAIHFEGIAVDNVLDLDGVLVDRDELQDTLGLNYTAGAFLRPLPARLYARLALPARARMTYALEADVRNLPGYVPHAVLSATHAFRTNEVRAEISAGGFGGWRLGLGASHVFGRCFRMELRAPNVLGLVSGTARGKSAMLTLELVW